MATLWRVITRWDGFVGAPGYSVFHFNGMSAGLMSDIHNFWVQVGPYLPTGVTLTTLSSGYQIDSDTGIANGTWAQTAGAVVTGATSGVYSAPAGAVMTWKSSTLNSKGHLIRGRTFIVPLGGASYDTNGSLSTAAAGGLQTAATALVSLTTKLRLWARPIKDASGTIITPGIAADATAAVVPDKAVTLRSRRD